MAAFVFRFWSKVTEARCKITNLESTLYFRTQNEIEQISNRDRLIFTAFPCCFTACQCLRRCIVLNTGRAGRVRAGLCIHLFSSHRAERLEPQQVRESAPSAAFSAFRCVFTVLVDCFLCIVSSAFRSLTTRSCDTAFQLQSTAFHRLSSWYYSCRSQLPEIQRVPLEQLCLRIKVLGFPGTVRTGERGLDHSVSAFRCL